MSYKEITGSSLTFMSLEVGIFSLVLSMLLPEGWEAVPHSSGQRKT